MKAAQLEKDSFETERPVIARKALQCALMQSSKKMTSDQLKCFFQV